MLSSRSFSDYVCTLTDSFRLYACSGKRGDISDLEAQGHACREETKRHRRRNGKRSLLWLREQSDRRRWQAKGHACREKRKRQRRRKSKRSPLWQREQSDRRHRQAKGHACREELKRHIGYGSARSRIKVTDSLYCVRKKQRTLGIWCALLQIA